VQEGINKERIFMTKILITNADGTPMKSKISAIQFLKKQGIDKELLIEENGQFFYEEVVNEGVKEKVKVEAPKLASAINPLKDNKVTWETPVFQGEEKTKLYIPNTDIVATINCKHPAGQLRTINSFEIAIGQENFIMSLDLVSKIFRVWG
jgi:hypothetical protein